MGQTSEGYLKWVADNLVGMERAHRSFVLLREEGEDE
jgi:hypothetical protein